MSGRGIRQVRKQVGKLERVKHWLPAKLGDGAGNVKVTGKNNAVWVRVAGHGTPVIAYNYSGAANAHNLPVLVGKDDNVLVVKKFNMRGGWDPAYNPTVPPHANNHTWGGPDVVFLDTKQIMPLSVYVSSGMVVAIVPGVISSPTGVVKVNSTTVTLTAPVSGMRLDLIQVDLATGAVSVKAGSAFDLEDYSLSSIPVPDGGYMGIAAIRLYAGQTAISNNFTDPDIIDLRFPSMTTGGGSVSALYLNYILLYHVNTITAYAPTEAGLTAALAASADGDTVVMPAYGFTDDFTVPAGVMLVGAGNESIIYGTVTLGDESWLQEIKVVCILDDANTAVGIQGPSSGTAIMWHVSVIAANTSTGNAYAINLNGGSITIQTGTLRAQYTDGAAKSRILYSSGSETCSLQFVSLAGNDNLGGSAPANWRIAEGATANLYGCMWHTGYDPLDTTLDPLDSAEYSDNGDRSAADHTHAVPDYPGLDTISLYHAGTVTTYDADATGLAAALSAATSGDVINVPPADITGNFTVPAGVTLTGYGNITRILGQVTLGHGSWLQDIKVQNIASSADPVVAIVGPGAGNSAFGWYVYVYAANTGTGDAYAVNLNGGSVTMRNGTIRAQYTDGAAKSRIFFEGTTTTDQRGWVDFISLLGTALLTDAAPANWEVCEGAVVGVSNCEWHTGHTPASGVTYASGDRSPINHTHVEADITDLDHTDATAIHDNVAGEISAITEKTTPVGADMVVIEDSADGNAKKMVQVSNLESGHTHQAFAAGVTINESGADSDTRIESNTEEYMVFVNAGTDTAYLGGITNGVEIGKGGEFKLIGTATQWEDLRIEPVARTTGTNAPTFEKWLDDSGGTSRGVYLYSFDDAAANAEKEIFFTMQMPHAWAGTAIELHVHWLGNTADTTSAPRWGLEYAWAEIGATYGDSVIVYSDGKNYQGSGDDADITAFKHYISKFASLSPSSSQDGISSILIGRLFRNSSDAGDTYDASGNKCGLLYIDAHYEVNTLGSTSEYVK